jgi:hypothetical protein
MDENSEEKYILSDEENDSFELIRFYMNVRSAWLAKILTSAITVQYLRVPGVILWVWKTPLSPWCCCPTQG